MADGDPHAANTGPEAMKHSGKSLSRAPSMPKADLGSRFALAEVPSEDAGSSGMAKSLKFGQEADDLSASGRGSSIIGGADRNISLEQILAENERLRRENEALKKNKDDASMASPIAGPLSQGAESLNASQEVVSQTAEKSAPPKTLKKRGRGEPLNIRTWTRQRMDKQQQQNVSDSQEAPQLTPFEIDATGNQLVASDSNVQDSQASQPAVGSDVASEPDLVVSALKPEQHPWLPQCSLIGASSELWTEDAEVRARLEDSFQELFNGLPEAAFTKFEAAFSAHLSHLEQPHLAFSAAMLTFFGLLRDATLKNIPDVSGDVARDVAFARACAESAVLLRKLTTKAMYGEKPPKKRPRDVPRSRHVREMCAQVGVSLDLVRLSCIQKDLAKGVRPAVGSQSQPRSQPQSLSEKLTAPLTDGEEPSSPPKATALTLTAEALESHTMLHEQTRQEKEREDRVGIFQQLSSISREEREYHLKRAGRYLASLQMDMDREHDEATYEATLAAHTRGKKNDAHSDGEDSGATPRAGAPLDDILDVGENPDDLLDVGENVDDLQIVLVDAESANCQEAVPSEPDPNSGSTSMKLEDQGPGTNQEAKPAEEPKSAEELVAEEEIDPKLDLGLDLPVKDNLTMRSYEFRPVMKVVEADSGIKPSFGQFIDKHILPLYIADIPFINLKILTEHYCGIPIDSDDEERVWSGVGRAARAALQPAHGPKKSEGRKGRTRTKSGDSAEAGTPKRELARKISRTDPVSEAKRARKTEALDELAGAQSSMRPPAPVLRAQMSTSVVEKRRMSRKAHFDMTVPSMPPPPFKKRDSIASVRMSIGGAGGRKSFVPRMSISSSGPLAFGEKTTFAPATPVRRASTAFMAPPSPMPEQSLPTPVTLKRKSLLQDGPLAPCSPSPAALDPLWGLLDTPRR